MIQNTITQYIDTYVQNGTPFHTYYMTVSGHGGYGWGHAMAAKNRAKAQAAYPNASPQVQACSGRQPELENALTYLVNALSRPVWPTIPSSAWPPTTTSLPVVRDRHGLL